MKKQTYWTILKGWKDYICTFCAFWGRRSTSSTRGAQGISKVPFNRLLWSVSPKACSQPGTGTEANLAGRISVHAELCKTEPGDPAAQESFIAHANFTTISRNYWEGGTVLLWRYNYSNCKEKNLEKAPKGQGKPKYCCHGIFNSSIKVCKKNVAGRCFHDVLHCFLGECSVGKWQVRKAIVTAFRRALTLPVCYFPVTQWRKSSYPMFHSIWERLLYHSRD